MLKAIPGSEGHAFPEDYAPDKDLADIVTLTVQDGVLKILITPAIEIQVHREIFEDLPNRVPGALADLLEERFEQDWLEVRWMLLKKLEDALADPQTFASKSA